MVPRGHAGEVEQARAWLEQCMALAFELGYKEVMAYALASFVQVEAGVFIRLAERASFERAKVSAEQQLGGENAAIRAAATALPLEEALCKGRVLVEVRSP